MSLALATKGIISGVGFGSGGGSGGLYPDGYIASTIEIDVDVSEPSISVSADDSIDIGIALDSISVSTALDSLDVSITVEEPDVEVDV